MISQPEPKADVLALRGDIRAMEQRLHASLSELNELLILPSLFGSASC